MGRVDREVTSLQGDGAAARNVIGRAHLVARPDRALIHAGDISGLGRQVFVPDTNVYILDAAGALPGAASIIVDQGLMFHYAVCLAELSAGIGKYSPHAGGWRATADYYAALFAAMPANRLLVPDAETSADAGMIAGILTRIQGLQKHQSKDLLNDAAVYLCAAKRGIPVLTGNKADFDLLRQIAPGGSFIAF